MFPISSRRCTGRGAAANAGGEGGRGEGGRLRERRTIFLVGLRTRAIPGARQRMTTPSSAQVPSPRSHPRASAVARSLARRTEKKGGLCVFEGRII